MSADALEILVQGPEAAAVVGLLRAALDDGGASCEVHELRSAGATETERDAATVVAVIGLVLQIPAALLAVYDLTQRLKKVEQAERLQQAAQVSVEQHSTTTITLKDGRGVQSLDARALLDLVAQLQAAQRKNGDESGGR